MGDPKFQVGDEVQVVLVEGDSLDDLSSETRAIIGKTGVVSGSHWAVNLLIGYEGWYYFVDGVPVYDVTEPALRLIHKPAGESFDEIVRKLTNGELEPA